MKTKDFFNWARFRVGKQTILVKTFGTLYLSCIKNLIQVKPPLASHAGVFRGARVSFPPPPPPRPGPKNGAPPPPPSQARDEIRAPLKTPAWEAKPPPPREVRALSDLTQLFVVLEPSGHYFGHWGDLLVPFIDNPFKTIERCINF